MTIQNTTDWFRQAVPEPNNRTLGVQLGCHFEEVAEMLDAIEVHNSLGLSPHYEAALDALERLASALKDGRCHVHGFLPMSLLDSIVDQQVTGTGVGYMLGMDVEGALREVNRSNWSKFENGSQVFDANGKIRKGRDYSEPNLLPYLGLEITQ